MRSHECVDGYSNRSTNRYSERVLIRLDTETKCQDRNYGCHSFRAMNAMAGAVSNELYPEGAAAIEVKIPISPLLVAVASTHSRRLSVSVCPGRRSSSQSFAVPPYHCYLPKSMPDIERSRSRKRHSAADLLSYAKPSNIIISGWN